MPKRIKKIRVAVVYGGVSGEHEVSLVSARSVMDALDKAKYDVLPVKIDKKGRWSVPQATLARRADVVFPLVHGTGGEDGCLQGVLELMGLPYVGSGVLGSALGMDKIVMKKVFAQYGLPVAAYESFSAGEWRRGRDRIVAAVEQRLAYPCFVKPANMGSSVGISKAHHRKELLRGIADALRYDRRVVVEAAVPGAREIECAVLGNEEPRASLPGEVEPSNEFYDYAAKYVDGASRVIIPAGLPKAVVARIQEMSIAAFRALDAAGLARVDFFVQRDSGDIFINEINTLPGFTDISMYPKMWAASGLPYPALLDELVRLALERGTERRKLVRSFTPPKRRKAAKRSPGRRGAAKSRSKRGRALMKGKRR
jgi:D-alanine-D-alanine ligase